MAKKLLNYCEIGNHMTWKRVRRVGDSYASVYVCPRHGGNTSRKKVHRKRAGK
jgi:hypothetical protein